MSLQDEIKKRRTFAIISHPDAGKTTITEQLLFFGGELREAGTVKGKKTGNFADQQRANAVLHRSANPLYFDI